MLEKPVIPAGLGLLFHAVSVSDLLAPEIGLLVGSARAEEEVNRALEAHQLSLVFGLPIDLFAESEEHPVDGFVLAKGIGVQI